MENASKALTMAGGILIAVLVIGLVVYMFSSSGNLFQEQQSEEEIAQLKAFNEPYISYNRKLLRGTDVISVMNKVINNNTKYEVSSYSEPYYIQVNFEMKEAILYPDVIFNIGQKYDSNSLSKLKNNQEAFTDFKRRIFDCTEIKYDNTTGRVNYMLFIERKMNTGNNTNQN